MKKITFLSGIAAAAVMSLVVACGGETEIKTVEVIKEVPVEKIVEVPVEKIVKEEVIKEVTKEVPVEVIKEVEVEKVVEKEVAVEVVKEVIKEVQVEVAAEAVAAAEASEAQPIDMPASANASGQIVVAVTDVPPGVGLGSAQLADGFH